MWSEILERLDQRPEKMLLFNCVWWGERRGPSARDGEGVTEWQTTEAPGAQVTDQPSAGGPFAEEAQTGEVLCKLMAEWGS